MHIYRSQSGKSLKLLIAIKFKNFLWHVLEMKFLEMEVEIKICKLVRHRIITMVWPCEMDRIPKRQWQETGENER
jgi:hypothetical protein